jgi:hypothetical protein
VTESRFGDVLCNTATPPASQSDQSPAMTGCVAAAKGFAFSVGVMGPRFKTPPERVKLLAVAVAKRLP